MRRKIEKYYPGYGDGRRAVGWTLLLLVGLSGLLSGLNKAEGPPPSSLYWVTVLYFVGLGSVGVLPTCLHRIRSSLMTVGILLGLLVLAGAASGLIS